MPTRCVACQQTGIEVRLAPSGASLYHCPACDHRGGPGLAEVEEAETIQRLKGLSPVDRWSYLFQLAAEWRRAIPSPSMTQPDSNFTAQTLYTMAQALHPGLLQGVKPIAVFRRMASVAIDDFADSNTPFDKLEPIIGFLSGTERTSLLRAWADRNLTRDESFYRALVKHDPSNDALADALAPTANLSLRRRIANHLARRDPSNPRLLSVLQSDPDDSVRGQVARSVVNGSASTLFEPAVQTLQSVDDHAPEFLRARYTRAVDNDEAEILTLLEPIIEAERLARERTSGGLSVATPSDGALSTLEEAGRLTTPEGGS